MPRRKCEPAGCSEINLAGKAAKSVKDDEKCQDFYAQLIHEFAAGKSGRFATCCKCGDLK